MNWMSRAGHIGQFENNWWMMGTHMIKVLYDGVLKL